VIKLIVKCDGCPNPFRQDRFRLALGHNNNDREKTMDVRTFLFFSNNAATSKLRNWAKTA
jgi:hypothetical protein